MSKSIRGAQKSRSTVVIADLSREEVTRWVQGVSERAFGALNKRMRNEPLTVSAVSNMMESSG